MGGGRARREAMGLAVSAVLAGMPWVGWQRGRRVAAGVWETSALCVVGSHRRYVARWSWSWSWSRRTCRRTRLGARDSENTREMYTTATCRRSHLTSSPANVRARLTAGMRRRRKGRSSAGFHRERCRATSTNVELACEISTHQQVSSSSEYLSTGILDRRDQLALTSTRALATSARWPPDQIGRLIPPLGTGWRGGTRRTISSG